MSAITDEYPRRDTGTAVSAITDEYHRRDTDAAVSGVIEVRRTAWPWLAYRSPWTVGADASMTPDTAMPMSL